MKLSNRPAKWLHAALVAAPLAATAAALVAAAPGLLAQPVPVPDPTRPPGVADAGPRTAKPQRSAAPVAAAPAPAALPRLLAVQVAGANGDSSALFDGRVVRVGDRLGEHTVTAIDRAGLTLRGPRGEQRLPLLTGITQTASRAVAPADESLATGSPQDKRP